MNTHVMESEPEIVLLDRLGELKEQFCSQSLRICVEELHAPFSKGKRRAEKGTLEAYLETKTLEVKSGVRTQEGYDQAEYSNNLGTVSSDKRRQLRLKRRQVERECTCFCHMGPRWMEHLWSSGYVYSLRKEDAGIIRTTDVFPGRCKDTDACESCCDGLHSFYVPQNVSVVMSDLTTLERHPHILTWPEALGVAQPAPSTSDLWDVILADPPWPSRSLLRCGAYWSDPRYKERLEAGLLSLTQIRGRIIAVWVTNNPAVEAFVRDQLLPAWGVCRTEVWIWVKTCTDGSPVTPFGNPHRRPYEKLLVGFTEGGADCARPLGAQKLLFGSPVTEWHSSKPLLEGLLPGRRRLELFARFARRGWTCWGNQVLARNREEFYEGQAAAGTPPKVKVGVPVAEPPRGG